MTFGQNNTKELKAIIGEIKLSEILSAFNYIDNNGIPSKRGADTCYFIHNNIQYPVKLVTEIINNVIKNNTKQLSPAEHDPWQDAPLYDDIDFPDDIILITPYNNSGRKCVEQFRQELLDNFTSLNIVNVNTNYTKIEKDNKNIAEIHFLNKRDNQFKILVNYDLLPKEMTTTLKKSIKGFRKVPDSHKWTLNGEYYVTTNPQTVKFAIKAINAIIENNNNFDQIPTKFWLYAAGAKSCHWNEFYNQGIMAVGWNKLGNLKKYSSKEEIAKELQKDRSDNSYPMNDSKTNWEFANEMNIGDIVYVKKGLEPILLGRGVVASDYIYDDIRNKYKSIRKVNWTHNGIYNVDFNELDIKQWNLKTLTDISENKYKDFCKKIEKIFNNNAKEDKNMNSQPLNQILYGPPGTGKTYNTIIKAMEIINDKKYDSVDYEQYKDLKKQFDNLKQQGQIEFVTFHQSYSYEEFVEGIKPDLENGKELRYKLQNGIFKTICNNAKELLETKVKYNFNKDNISVYKILIPDESLFAYCIENDCVAINWGNDIDISNCDSQEEIIAKIPEDFESRKQCIFQLNLFKLWIDNDLKSGKDVIVVIPGSMNTIKGIAKITGDYFYNSDIENGHQQRKVDWIRKNINISSDNIYNSKFVSPTITGMFNDKINWDTFLNLINNKNNSKSSNAVLVIDEINRGDVSKIFGELITLIEEDKRIGKEHQMTVTLPYSREPFGVPNNLYIIGTMNTADRSIALLDTALRRRFDFEEMMPKPELLIGKDIEGVDLEQLLTKINDRIKNEYDRDHQIGHSYLMEVENKEQLERAYKNRILPLLNEYFYNDIDSVAKILNCKPNDISSKENWFNVLKEAQKSTKKDNEQ